MVQNTAFVFVKPHANTEKAQEVTKAFLESKDIKILEEGTITGKEIDEKKLIDNHYYSIASKATILKPSELNVPQDKFKEKFSEDWEECLKAGKVMNAMDACAKLELSPTELDTNWAAAKAGGRLVKFGGGFYCGKVECEGEN
jgi:nucleosome binding factor SPN SPT16 subunit